MSKENKYKDLGSTSVHDKFISLNKGIKSAKGVDEWKEVISYVMKHEHGHSQYWLLKKCLDSMNNFNYETMDDLCYNIDSYFNISTSLPTTLLLSKYILLYDYKGCDTVVERGCKYSIAKYGLLSKEVDEMEGVEFHSLDRNHLEYVEVAMDILPNVSAKCRGLSLNSSQVLMLVRWVCVVSTESVESLVRVGRFCGFLVKKINGHASESTRVEEMGLFVGMIVDCLKSGFVDRAILLF